MENSFAHIFLQSTIKIAKKTLKLKICVLPREHFTFQKIINYGFQVETIPRKWRENWFNVMQ